MTEPICPQCKGSGQPVSYYGEGLPSDYQGEPVIEPCPCCTFAEHRYQQGQEQAKTCASCHGPATTCHNCLCAACDDARQRGYQQGRREALDEVDKLLRRYVWGAMPGQATAKLLSGFELLRQQATQEPK